MAVCQNSERIFEDFGDLWRFGHEEDITDQADAD